MVIFSSQYTQHQYTKAAALPSVTYQSTHKTTTTQSVIQNISSRSRVHVLEKAYMIMYRL
jgi:hypothetical protein